MRVQVVTIASVLALAALVLGVQTLAQGEDGGSDATQALQHRVKVLELQVKYLLSREEAVTEYVLAGGAQAGDLAKALARARAEGFTMGAFAPPSREALLSGLEGAARSAQEGLPDVTKDEAKLLKEATRLSKLKR